MSTREEKMKAADKWMDEHFCCLLTEKDGAILEAVWASFGVFEHE